MKKIPVEINFKKGKLISGIIYPEFFPINKSESVLNVGCGDGVQAVVYQGNFKTMVGIDINSNRLEVARNLVKYYNIDNTTWLKANVEKIPLQEKFDKCIAIDIIEHVINPGQVIQEIHRLLKHNGQLLITFPALHDKWENLFRFIGRKILRRRGKTIFKPGWDPDQHQYNYKLKQWLKILETNGFKLIKSRGSTLFPPLHYLGFPKFWFTNKFIHTFDNFLSQLPIFKNYDQALVCIFEKK